MALFLIKILKTSLVFIIVCIAFVLNYLFFAWFLSLMTTTPSPLQGEKSHTVYVLSNGVHTDIVFHESLLSEDFWGQLKKIEGRPYIAIGWGDKGFYLYTPTWAELKISTALTAAFLPSPTLMHVTHYMQVQPNWKSIELTDKQLENLKKFIKKSFASDKEQKIQILEGAGYGKYDFFYNAVGNYSCFYTCNIWVNQALKKAEIKTAIWSPFDKGIMKHL